MLRIVKAGAYVRSDAIDKSHGEHYMKSDTREIKPGWRPDGYRNPFPLKYAGTAPCGHDAAGYENGCHDGFQAGFDACLKALGEVK